MNPDPTSPFSSLEFELLNRFQRDFPLVERPFVALAAALDASEAGVLGGLHRLQQAGAVSRVGAVFQPHAIGASALAALAVPEQRLTEVADKVSACAEVNHNYEREHRYNLWFVVTAPSTALLRSALHRIEETCQSGPILVLPMCEQYHIDLGFDLAPGHPHQGAVGPVRPVTCVALPATLELNNVQQVLVGALQRGLPLVERPYACLGLPEAQAIKTIEEWLRAGVIKRFGVIVRHQELGYSANAMAVWDIPDTEVSAAGRRIATSGAVSLCYRRARQLPDWHYNLFCMIHGKDRSEVQARVSALSESYGLAAYAHDVLFSRRRFKQRGAHYAPAAPIPEVLHGPN